MWCANKQMSYWDDHPVARQNTYVTRPITENIPVISSDLPKSLAFTHLTAENTDEIYTFLKAYYIRDGDTYFHYSKAVLRWFFTSPGGCVLVGLRSTKDESLKGFVAGIRYPLRFQTHHLPSAAVDFLTVHPSLRKLRITVFLVNELVRSLHNRFPDLKHAIYTSGTLLPGRISTMYYYQRYLDPERLVNSGYIQNLSGDHTINPEGENPWQKVKHTDFVYFDEAFREFDVAPAFSETIWHHWFGGRKHVIESFINRQRKLVVSGFRLDIQVGSFEITIKTFYLLCAMGPLTKNDCMWLCDMLRKKGYHVIDIIGNGANFNFCTHSGAVRSATQLHYYMYNWQCSQVDPKRLAVSLV